jgi:hypothetical protein
MEGMKGDEWKCDQGWVEHELGEADFGDVRLTKRLLKVGEDLSLRPQVPINHASEDWAATKAAYRLFSNERVSSEELFSVHRKRTCERLSQEEVVLAIQDTTYLNYNTREKCEGLGYIGEENLKGVIIHNTLAVTPLGLPLGLLEQKKYTRLKLKRLKESERQNTPIEEKESFRWIEALRATVGYTNGAKKVISVCDREGDIYEFLMEAHNLQANYLVRSSSPRQILDDNSMNIVEAVEKRPSAGTLDVKIPSREGRKGRTAKLEVRYVSTTLSPPHRSPAARSMELMPLRVSIVLVSEPEPPEGAAPLRWILLTNMEVSTFEEAVEKIHWYKARWHIETYHKVLKSGCKVEDCRLQTIEALLLYLTMFGIIAWRIYWFTHVSRTNPTAPARAILAKTELEALSMLAGRKTKTKLEIKNARMAVIEIAKLGGFLARKHDGHPGPTVIWRGWTRLSDATEMFETMRAQSCG